MAYQNEQEHRYKATMVNTDFPSFAWGWKWSSNLSCFGDQTNSDRWKL